MAHFWIPKTSESGRCWAALPLAGSAYRFKDSEPYVQPAEAVSQPTDIEHLARLARETTEDWFLVAPPGSRLRVNGRVPFLGAHALADRDEIRLLNGQRLYFSSERLPQVVPFPGADHEIFCARCTKPIEKGVLSVTCPACGAACHQTEKLPCWNYEGTTHCPLCDQTNDAEAGFRWTPECL